MMITTRLELDLAVLLDNSNFKINPTIFFKQNDFGYCVGNNTIKLGEENLEFVLNKDTTYLYNENGLNLQFLNISKETDFFSEINRDLFISYNVKEMDKILILNFFRFLDCLKPTIPADDPSKCSNGAFLPSGLKQLDSIEPATAEINRIYNSINALNDEELLIFLKELGQKMSSGAEFNFSGAYKIDLKALKSLTLYESDSTITQINIKDLCDELKRDQFDLLNILKKYNPEIFKSSYFIEFLLSQAYSQEAKTAILEIGI